MRNGKWNARIPTTKTDRVSVQKLGRLIGRSLGGPGLAAGLAIDWAIANSRKPDPAFRPYSNGGDILQLHVHLDRDYREQGFQPLEIGSLLNQGIGFFFGRFSPEFRNTPGIGGMDKLWIESHEASAVREVYRQGFAEGRDPAQAFLEAWNGSIRSLLQETPSEARRARVDVWTDPEGRALYDQLDARLSEIGIDTDSAIATRIVTLLRRPL